MSSYVFAMLDKRLNFNFVVCQAETLRNRAQLDTGSLIN